MKTTKVLISSKKNLQNKYGTKFKAVEKLLSSLVESDGRQDITTQIIYIDDPASVSKAGIKAVKSVTRPSAKKAVDDICKKLAPAYIVLFGSQDVFPFQEIKNPVDNLNDEDRTVPSDLPYACDAPYSTNISSFTGPTRVVGRIPDIPGVADTGYLKTVFNTIINYKKVKSEKLLNYFAITADVWKKSTQLSLSNMFGNYSNLKFSPSHNAPHSYVDLKPLTHFYNCHGLPDDSKYYGQRGKSNFPTAQYSHDINGKISKGTIVAAECCYGAELFDPNNEDTHNMSMSNTYLKNKAIAFTGSSTIAYGPSTGNALADLITQYFIINIINGASTGRALLEARQKFLSVNGPALDPFELKTLAQFYLLGDPSIHVVIETSEESAADTVDNRRLNLFNKGINLKATIAPSERVDEPIIKSEKSITGEMKKIFELTGFTGKEDEVLYAVKTKNKKVSTFAKGLGGQENINYHAYIQKHQKANGFTIFDVLVFKESGNNILGWRLYHSK